MSNTLPTVNNVTPQQGDSLKVASPPATEQRVLLEGISWETFERLLEETSDQRNQRFSYCDGLLEIMVPLVGHEEPIRLFEHFVGAIIDELGLEMRSLGSLTMKSPQQHKGLEPDCCFYIQHEAVVRGVESLDFEVHPPPDLVIEVDNSQSSLNKFPIYVALHIPEIWRLRHGQLTVYHLDSTNLEYNEHQDSLSFPNLPVHILPRFIERAKTIGQRAAVRELTNEIRQFLPK